MIGIIGAIPEEIDAIIAAMDIQQTRTLGNRKYTVGILEEKEVVVVFSRIGKVAAAITTTTLIHEFKITQLLFTGVAGGLAPTIQVGDLVVATHLAQHDFDAYPLFPKNEVALTQTKLFKTTSKLTTLSTEEIHKFIEQQTLNQYITQDTLAAFHINKPHIHTGLIVSGDQFVHKKEQSQKILHDFPDALCVEMEGAAVAQVCFEYKIPFTVIRTISDHANESASIDFNAFIHKVAKVYGLCVIKSIVAKIETPN